MLPQLGVQMNEAKALKYFNMCDTDGGGDIDLDEFKSALFAVDPNSGNTTGFQPSVLLTPQDAFELFDVSSRKGLERENGTNEEEQAWRTSGNSGGGCRRGGGGDGASARKGAGDDM